MHTNHRRKNKQKYPWDNRAFKPRDYSKYFRAAEKHCMQRFLVGDDPENLIWPTKLEHIDRCNPWHYD